MHELILGGAKSGKSRAAEARAGRWLSQSTASGQPDRQALLIATAVAGDGDMAARIARHRADRVARQPQLACLELDGASLAQALVAESRPGRLLVVDCLTLWLTQWAMPVTGPHASASQLQMLTSELSSSLQAASGPVVLVSNEISLGVLPLGAETRRFVDALGLLHQAVAACCERVTLMVAGCELAVKGTIA